MNSKTTTIDNLGLNDIEGAVTVAKQYRHNGKWGHEIAQVLYNMQDDPSALMKRLVEEGFK